MILLFAAIQLGVNALLLLTFHGLLADRRAAERDRRERESRLEGLAAELCRVAESIDRERRGPAAAAPAPPPEAPPRDEPPPRRPLPLPEPAAGRRQQAEGWLARGLAVETVAARLDMPEGEVELLRNLRRPPDPPAARPRRPGRPGTSRVAADREPLRTQPEPSQPAPRRPPHRMAARRA